MSFSSKFYEFDGLDVAGKGNPGRDKHFNGSWLTLQRWLSLLYFFNRHFLCHQTLPIKIFPLSSWVYFQSICYTENFQLTVQWYNFSTWFTYFSGLFYIHVQNCIMYYVHFWVFSFYIISLIFTLSIITFWKNSFKWCLPYFIFFLSLGRFLVSNFSLF